MKLTHLVAVAALVVGSSMMKADEVQFVGSAQGAFDGSPIGSTSTLGPGLNYYGSTFNNTTVGGFLAIGGNGVASTSNVNNFGAVTLASTNSTYKNTFTLMISFTAPGGIAGGQSTVYTADLVGNVDTTGNGGVQISFLNPTTMFTFANSTQTGSFTLNVNNVSVTPGNVSSITGTIISTASPVSPVPEPTSLTLLGTGLVGLAGFARRKFFNV